MLNAENFQTAKHLKKQLFKNKSTPHFSTSDILYSPYAVIFFCTPVTIRHTIYLFDTLLSICLSPMSCELCKSQDLATLLTGSGKHLRSSSIQ